MSHVEPRVHSVEPLKYYQLKGSDGLTVLDRWERVEAFNDSVTPSTWSPDYRAWIVGRLKSLCEFGQRKRLLSIGCGNGFVEAELVSAGYNVSAFDALPESVELARMKGVAAVVCDFWNSDEVMGTGFDVAYADGVIGHLLGSASMGDILAVFRKLVAPGGRILISNDSAANGRIENHPSVAGFFYIHSSYFASAAKEAGFKLNSIMEYRYFRPISGRRWRAVVEITA